MKTRETEHLTLFLAEANGGERRTELLELIRLFESLATVSGVTGKEAAIALQVKKLVRDYPVEIFEDEAGKSFAGNQGNLILVPKHHDTYRPALAFLAHLDTVRDTGKTKVMVQEDRLTSAGNTQLGADNRWGLTLLMKLMDEYFSLPEAERANLVFVCTVGEEAGMLGARQLDLSTWNVQQAIVLDSALHPGSYIETCAGMSLFEAEFTGRAAHSAVKPAEGISAVVLAAHALSRISDSLLPENVTANVGGIEGGDLSVSNVVPAACRFSGEVRAPDAEMLKSVIDEFSKICSDSANKAGGSVIFKVTPDFAPYRHKAKSPIITYIQASLRASGLTPSGVSYSGGSDANALNEAGIPAVNLGIGAQKPHSDDEFILLADMLAGKDMICGLLNHATEFLEATIPSPETQTNDV